MNVLSAVQGGNTSVATHLGGMSVGFVYMKLIPRINKWERMKWANRAPQEEGPGPLGFRRGSR